ncbi:MAG: ATP synthase F1 subunit epsilon [Paludibacteraceae bacterium]|nr:ATP synthase F1 subunit epsilon [Paludibacteraceae bacterium]MBP6283926.1 ATP synthase F1 subunit epsilon [Paludibacteraceae bacterium]
MTIHVFAPHKTLFSGKATAVSLPGTMGKFTILEHHAPLVSLLQKGEIYISKSDKSNLSLSIVSGFVEVSQNKVKICIEVN